jgi:hypothetical protein
MRTGALWLIVAVAVSLVAHAQEDRFVVVGSGTTPCGTFLEVSEKNKDKGDRTPEIILKASMMMAWTQGYLSGINLYRSAVNPKPPLLVLPGAATITLYLEKYCREHPLDRLNDGSFALFADVMAKATNEK